MKKIVSFLLVLALTVSIFTGCTGKSANTAENTSAQTSAASTVEENPYKDPVTLTYYVYGDEYPDGPLVYEKVNKILKEKINTTIEFKYVSEDNYNVLLSSGEKYDLIGVINYLGFWDFAIKGAFAEITDDMVKKSAPNLAKRLDTDLKLDKYNGKRYGIPTFGNPTYKDVYMVRGDLMKKYNVEAINTFNDLEKFLDAVAANEKDIVPFAINSVWTMPGIFMQEYDLVGPDNNAYALVNVKKDDYKLVDPYTMPETLEFVKKMKAWSDKGYWSKSALSSKVSTLDAFKQGKSAITGANLDTANGVYKQFQADERKAWDIKIFPRKYNALLSKNGSGVAISNNSSQKERALAALDLLKCDSELNMLMMHGIEGKHYQKIADRQRLPLDDKGYNWTGNGLDNADTFLQVGGGFPDSAEILKKIEAAALPNKLLDFTIDKAPIEQESAALLDVFKQYVGPLFLGLVDDPEKELKAVNEKRAAAGLQKYMTEVQKQIDTYIGTAK